MWHDYNTFRELKFDFLYSAKKKKGERQLGHAAATKTIMWLLPIIKLALVMVSQEQSHLHKLPMHLDLKKDLVAEFWELWFFPSKVLAKVRAFPNLTTCPLPQSSQEYLTNKKTNKISSPSERRQKRSSGQVA